MEIRRNGSQPAAKGPADYFTGAVRIDGLFKVPARGRPHYRAHPHRHPGASRRQDSRLVRTGQRGAVQVKLRSSSTGPLPLYFAYAG